VLIFDESAFAKERQMLSAGVARQWKWPPGQGRQIARVGVFSATLLPGRDGQFEFDARLYLPKAWTEDEERCVQSGHFQEAERGKRAPQQERIGLTGDGPKRPSVAGFSLRLHSPGGTVGYGKGNRPSLRGLDRLGCRFVADVHLRSETIYLDDPTPQVPALVGPRKRPVHPSRPKPLDAG